MADPTNLALVETYFKLARECEDDEQAIEFFDKYPEAFDFETECLDEARISYSEDLQQKILDDGGDQETAQAEMEDFWYQLKSGERKALPDEYKLQAFDSVIEGSPVFGHLRDRED